MIKQITFLRLLLVEYNVLIDISDNNHLLSEVLLLIMYFIPHTLSLIVNLYVMYIKWSYTTNTIGTP